MIVDDEQEAIDYLAILIAENFPDIKIVATSKNSKEAVELTCRKHPDLIFLDIKIDLKNGFDVVRELEQENHKPHIIFVTAFTQFAVEAFKVNATDYLLKPVDPDDLKRAVNKYLKHRESNLVFENRRTLMNNYQPKVKFNTQKGYILVNPMDVIYCESDGNYSQIYLKGKTKKTVCYNLGNLLTLLPKEQFQRISRYNIINEFYLSEVNRGKQKCILSVDGEEVRLNYSSKMFGFRNS